ncbi:MAG: glycosyltransferase family 8 protein [Pseudomonadota bacterium]|nr:glycosyltransferase family 8 protein [Pseudomonadota bacterium]
MSKSIPIFCATDENYAPFTSMMMKSMLMHTKSFVDFYIMDGGIKRKTKKLIQKELKSFPNKTIRYIDMAGFDLSRFPSLAHFSVNTFSRYFVPELVPEMEKAIYMDVDIIVTGDIQELYDQDLKGFPIGVTPCDFNDYSMIHQIKRIWPDVKADSVAFNAGILVMDIPKLLKMDFTNKAVQLTGMLYDKLEMPDQDILNIMFENNYLALDYRFDFIHTTLPRLKKKYPDLKTIDPVMIHYTIKPWKSNQPFQEEFEDILKDSLFYQQVIRKWRSRKIRYYLFGKIPLGTKYVPKNIFLNQNYLDKKYPL